MASFRCLPDFLKLVEDLEKALEAHIQARTSDDKKLKREARLAYYKAQRELRLAIMDLY